jgi:hypothetical protein
MNDNTIRIYKGVDNKINFIVYDSDRKKTKIDQFNLVATMVSVENQERVLQKKAKLTTSTKGLFSLDILEREIADIAPGFYNFFVAGNTSDEYDTPTTPLYTDLSAHISMTVEIMPAVDMTPAPTKEVGYSDWVSQMEIWDDMPANVYYSSAFQANRIKNNIHASHTFAVNMRDFSGKFYLMGSLETVAPVDPNEFFKIDYMGDGVEHPFVHETSFKYYTFSANVRWLKFSWRPDSPILNAYERPSSLKEDNTPIVKVYLRA